MPEAYELHEARFIQTKLVNSAANALYAEVGPVPAGKVWTILCAAGFPSVDETQTVWMAIFIPVGGLTFPITTPASMALKMTPPIFRPGVTEGMEIKLYPGEYLRAYRGSATAGSSIYIAVRYIESDLPFYSYEEPQNKVVRQTFKRGSVYRASGGGISERGGGSGGPSGGGGGGGPKPV